MINAKIREFENDIINYANLCEDVQSKLST